jgi:hypothetical protein
MKSEVKGTATSKILGNTGVEFLHFKPAVYELTAMLQNVNTEITLTKLTTG